MAAIIAILLVIGIVLYESLKGSSTADIFSTGTPSGDSTTVYQNDNTGDGGLSPVDIGGVSLSIPSGLLQWRPLAEKYAQRFSILDPEEILAIIWNESSGNPNANNPNDPSWGLMGVTMLIGSAYAGVTSYQELLIPEKNVIAGSAFLAHLKATYSAQYPDTWSDGYNEGETKLSQGIILTPGYSQAFNSHVNALKGIG
jgi:hypothetical protein